MVQKREPRNKGKRRCNNNTTNTRGSLGKGFEEGLSGRIEEFQHLSERPRKRRKAAGSYFGHNTARSTKD